MSPPKLKLTGKHLKYPAEAGLREFLLACTVQFHESTGVSRSEICRRALNDPAFFGQVEAGRRIKIRTFETFMQWLDVHWPADPHSLQDAEHHRHETAVKQALA